jgi:hypothetical protein
VIDDDRGFEGTARPTQTVDPKDIAELKLGGWRWGVRAELRGLKELLRPGERILTAAVDAGKLSCGLLVSTDQRLLLTNKRPLRPQRCEELPYERIASLSVGYQWGTDSLTVRTADQHLSFLVLPAGRAAEMAGVVAQRIGAEKVSGAELEPERSTSGGQPANRHQPGGGSGGSEPPRFRDLDSRSGCLLTLKPHTLTPQREYWLLEQGSEAVGAIERTTEGRRHRALLSGPAQSWRVLVRRRRRRLGWHLEVAPVDGPDAAARYFPSTVMPGGRLVLPEGERYRLRWSLLRWDWRLVAKPGGELAWLEGPVGSKAYPAFRIGLATGAAGEPRLLLLLLAACAAMLLEGQQPRVGGPSGGP